MTVELGSDVYYDPYDVTLNADPYPTFRRLRDEAPLYYNADHDFYALSRFTNVNKGLVDHATFSSARGIILELIKANVEEILRRFPDSEVDLTKAHLCPTLTVRGWESMPAVVA